MSFSFLHTADWHIGKPFGRLPPERAAGLRLARLDCIDRLADAARSGGHCHVLVGGDVYDSPGLANRELREPMARLRSHVDIAWHIIPGNHDPSNAGGVWERLFREGLPANVFIHLEPRPSELSPGCFLLPAPLGAKAMTRDPSAWMDDATTPPGAIRVGLAHGSVREFGGDTKGGISIAADRAERARLDYLALGDWHGALRIGQRTWYSGTPEPDGFLDNDPGYALSVRIDGAGGPPAVARIETAQFRWWRRSIDLARPTDLAAFEAEIDRLGQRAGKTLVEVEPAGLVTLEQDAEIERRLARLDERLFVLIRRMEQVVLAPAAGDLDVLEEGSVRDIAIELSALAAGQGAESAVAARALRRLFAFASTAGEASP